MDNSCTIKTVGIPQIKSPLDAVQFIEDNEYVLLNPVVKVILYINSNNKINLKRQIYLLKFFIINILFIIKKLILIIM